MCFLSLMEHEVDLYDAVTHDYLVRDTEAKSSRLLVVLPAETEVKINDGKYMTNNKVVTYSQLKSDKIPSAVKNENVLFSFRVTLTVGAQAQLTTR